MAERRAVIDDLVNLYGDYCSPFTYKLRNGIKGEQIHKEGFINCHWNDKYKLIFMHIDKCASTSVSYALSECRPKFYPLDEMPRQQNCDLLAKYFVETDHLFFAITRDPVQRWISGLNEFVCRFRPPINWVVNQVKNKKYIFDEHTGPQKTFLRLCLENGGNLHLIKLDDNISPKLNYFIKSKLDDVDQFKFKPVPVPHKRNSKYFLPNYKSFCEKIYEDYVEPDKSAFDELYKYDYELYAKGI